jgi:hypothetical protein
MEKSFMTDDHGDCLIVDFIRTRSDTIHIYLFIDK